MNSFCNELDAAQDSNHDRNRFTCIALKSLTDKDIKPSFACPVVV